MAAKKRSQKSLDGFISSTAKKARIENDDASSVTNYDAKRPTSSLKTQAYIRELPGKIASYEAAAAVDANPPIGQLMNWMSEVRNVGTGDSVVYWMRNEDIRGTIEFVPIWNNAPQDNNSLLASHGQPGVRARVKTRNQIFHPPCCPLCDQSGRL